MDHSANCESDEGLWREEEGDFASVLAIHNFRKRAGAIKDTDDGAGGTTW